MKVTRLSIPDVILLEPRVFGDERGFFFESYNRTAFKEATGLDPEFVQDNHSRSVKGVLRGLHYQLQPKVQGKLVRVVEGEVFDVAVDIRKDSPTYGNGSGKCCLPRTNGRCGFRRGLRTGSSLCRTQLSSSIKRRISTRRRMSGVSAGMIRR